MVRKRTIPRGLTEESAELSLSQLIEHKHTDTLRVTNAALLTLFWQTGKHLSEYDNPYKGANIAVITDLSIRLEAEYGPFFSARNLKTMKNFFAAFPDPFMIAQLSPHISWAHIKLLLGVKNAGNRLLLIRQTIEHSLTVPELRKQIQAARSLPQTTTSIQFPKGKAKDNASGEVLPAGFGMDHLIRNVHLLDDFFSGRLHSSFRHLLEMPKTPVACSDEISSAPPISNGLFASIAAELEAFRRRHNRLLNIYLTMAFNDIGQRINQQNPVKAGVPDWQTIIGQVSAPLVKKYGGNFSETHLRQAAAFAMYFNGSNAAVELASLVSWPTIELLLSLENPVAILFYARLAAAKGWNNDDLQRAIAEKIYEKAKGGTDVSLQKMLAPASTTVEEKTERKGNAISKATIISIHIPERPDVESIFNNPNFPLLKRQRSADSR